MSKLDKAIREVLGTQPGHERNMYPSIKKIFESLGHKSKHILVDTGSELARGIPDLIVKVPIGRREKGKEIWGEWLVCEVKDEREAFATEASKKKIFTEKSKYITIDTAFFVMIDPERMVIRPIVPHARSNFDSSGDIVIEWQEALKHDDRWFMERCAPILAKNSGIGAALRRFREGDTSLIATVSLQPTDSTKREVKRAERARNDFLQTIRRATQMLQAATKEALAAVEPEMGALEEVLEEFRKKYGGTRIFSLEPFELRGEDVHAGNAYEHDRDVERVRDKLLANPSIAKLAFVWLPEFRSRIGKTKESEKRHANELFAIETANMILARILLLRFFEDHGFFGERRYICNGGVSAFQAMREYFGLSYTKLLKDVYEKARSIYYAVFEEMELDWVLGTDNEQLSSAIEISLMYFSRYDFTTVRGDILTGIYDRFLEGSQRKKLGEYYTKPSIARYIVERVDIERGDTVLDPACGSGTFLLEVFEKTIGRYIDAGVVEYEEAVEEIEHIRGNDLNPFSSTIAQIQFLWHLLPFREKILEKGFPKLNIAEKHNSLIPADLMGHDGSIYGRIDKRDYDAVIGNPPYVRPERSDQELPPEARRFYEEDIKPDKNLFTLFVYRALKSWCKEGGMLGFVIPLSLCDNNSNTNLRKLFKMGGRWKIVEIVDMEAISEKVFDASVQPIVFIAKNEPASEEDTIVIRIAGPECIGSQSGDIDLAASKEEVLPYQSVWSRDGRILTKIDHRRKAILDKLLAFEAFAEIAHRFWIKKEKNRIVAWQNEEPTEEEKGTEHWEQKICLTRGAVFRNQKPKISNGFDVYKGENIAAGMIEGGPVETKIDIQNVSDPSLWKYLDVLPARGFAFMRIASNLTAARFDPAKVAFLDTATLFFPKQELALFPFDLLVLSSIYQFFYAVYARMGAIEQLYSNLYPTNLRFLPWSDNLVPFQDDIEAMREEFYETCRAIYNRRETLHAKLLESGAVPFKELCISRGAGSGWKVEYHGLESAEEFEVLAPDTKPKYAKYEERFRIYPGDNMYEWIEVGDEFVAKALSAAMTIYHESMLKKSDLLNMPVPVDESALESFLESVREYDEGNALEKYDAILRRIDEMVGHAFGLSEDEIVYIQKEMREDPFLKRVKPKLPYSGKRKKGLLEALASSERYA